MAHSWQFVGTHIGSSTPGNDVPLVAAVCERCGEARSSRALLRPQYERVDLSGECPAGEAQHQPTKFTSIGRGSS